MCAYVKNINIPVIFFFSGEGDVLTVGSLANHGSLDEEGHEHALGSSSDPERSSMSGGLRDCDSELEDDVTGPPGSRQGDGQALADETTDSSPMHATASSLFIKRAVDEVQFN